MTVIDGIRDAGNHIESMAANCPKTSEVLGGYSQGAALAGFVTSAAVPPGVPAAAVPPPMPPEIANHVAAVTLFGTPSYQFLQQYGAPPIAIGPLYQPKTLELCAQGDAICESAGTPALRTPLPGERHDGPSRELRRQSPLVARQTIIAPCVFWLQAVRDS